VTESSTVLPQGLSNGHGTVGFIGLGIMGTGMCRNLLAAGMDLVVYNRTRSRTEPLAGAGAAVADSPRDLAQRCDVVLLCVSDTPDVTEVLLGEEGVASGARSGTLIVDLSTISPEATRSIAARLADQGVGFCDAPVSGGSEGAAKGTLSIMVGGAVDDVERAMPYLQAMGRTITHMGPVGSGQLCKLVNQVLGAVTMLGVSEALLLASAGGLDLTKAIAATEGGAGGSWLLSNRGPQMIARDWAPGFTIDLQQKDLRLVLDAADAYGVPLLATSTVFNLYRALQRADLGAEGNHALVKAIERLAGLTVGSEGA
jgi:3-hydroxyisobutyrate dehydrogenase-like beta-hydroxyacid dehydrogenase